MGILNIRNVQREGARLLIVLAGVSGSGKTRTAIELAYGLANGRADKIGFIDTENRRGSLYDNVLPKPFLIGDLFPPFSPDRYIEAIREFQETGVEVLIIDSVTHEWEGEGGCCDIAENTNSKLDDWKKAKKLHKRFMNAMLQCDMHVICCTRAREKTDFKDPRNPVALGVQPIQEHNFMFEATASLMMLDMGARQTVLKCPSDLAQVLGRGEGYIGSKDGRDLRAWVDGAKQLDRDVEHWRNRLQSECANGMAALQAEWKKAPERVRAALGDAGRCPDSLKSSAAAYDEARAAGEKQREPDAEPADGAPPTDGLDGWLPPAAQAQQAQPAQQSAPAAAPAPAQQQPATQAPAIPPEVDDLLTQIGDCATTADLDALAKRAATLSKKCPDHRAVIAEAGKRKRDRIAEATAAEAPYAEDDQGDYPCTDGGFGESD